jgi:hypothetical protein
MKARKTVLINRRESKIQYAWLHRIYNQNQNILLSANYQVEIPLGYGARGKKTNKLQLEIIRLIRLNSN